MVRSRLVVIGPVAFAAGLGLVAGAIDPPAAPAAPTGAAASELDLRFTDDAPSTHGPSPRGHAFDASATNAACASCHVDIADEWRASLHNASHVDPSYTRQFAREPLPFCQACHAPEADPTSAPSDAQSDLGTACVTCHVARGTILASASPRAGASSAPHVLTRTDAFTGAAACAPCHEFSFPNAATRKSPLLMQSTITEHAASGAVGCAECHMPIVPGPSGPHRSHAFAASRDAALVRGSVVVAASRDGDGRVRVRLEARGVGHAVPTGDLFRRIEVSAEAIGEDMQSLDARSVHLARHFAWGDGRDGKRVKVLRSDDRLVPGAAPTEIVLDLGRVGATHPIGWRVAYQRVDVPDDVDEAQAILDGEIVLASGTLDPAAPNAP